MNAGPVAELWADLLGELAERRPAPAVANAANAANRKDSRGAAADDEPCEELRISANAGRVAVAVSADSQGFAGVRSMYNGPQGQQPRGVLQDSHDSQGCPEATRCDVPAHDLSAAAWSDADVSRFLDRRARLLRWGWREADAERLADRLARRDREGNGRRLCVECAHLRGGRCRQAERAGIGGPEVGALAVMLQNCPAFEAGKELP